MYEITTIGAMPGARERAPRPVAISGLPGEITTFLTKPVVFGGGVVLGLVVGALVFGGRRRG